MSVVAGRVDWLPQVLKAAGLPVYVMPGALTRGLSNLSTIHGVVAHHTATGPNWDDDHVAALLRDGRRDLAGPLAQLGLERDGTYVVVATGRANHNGYGEWGNNSIGIEAYNSGVGEPWAPVQVRNYEIGAAAILKHCGLPSYKFKGHRETDPRRKIDPAGLDMTLLRGNVGRIMGAPPNSPPTIPEDDEVAQSIAFYKDPSPTAPSGTNHAYLLTNNVGKWLPTAEAIDLAESLGIRRANQPAAPLGKKWRDISVLVDGPCKNVT